MILALLAPTAAQIVADVQTHYAKQEQQTATFTQVVTDATFGRTTTSDGSVYLQRPDKMQWDYFPNTKGKSHKKFIFDGKMLWAIDYPSKRVQKLAASSNTRLPAAVGFLTGANLAKDFDLKLVDPTTVELVPKQASADVKSLRLVVDPHDWHVITSTVIDSQNTQTAFTFGAPSAAKIPADRFVFDPKQYPGFQVSP